MFADARGFTRFAERRSPQEVSETLSRLFRGCTDILFRYDAIVDKLMGDAVMAIFGAPIIRPDHAQQAIDAAIAIQENAASAFPADWEGACLRVGINTGAAFVGRVGSDDVKDYTAVGDTVNVAQRLQSEAEPGEVLVSASAYDQVRERFPGAQSRVLALKGRTEPVVAYSLTGTLPR